VFLQGTTSLGPVVYGDGLRCAGGTLNRLYTKNAAGGVVSAPLGGDLSVSAQSAALGDTIPVGALRYYQTYYRDPNVFCTTSTFNVSSGLSITWVP
jgi:hypothetical protein